MLAAKCSDTCRVHIWESEAGESGAQGPQLHNESEAIWLPVSGKRTNNKIGTRRESTLVVSHT